ncbi:MAG: hypothetical protein R3F40_17855 [Candidatus Competibacteraceae bacterium]
MDLNDPAIRAYQMQKFGLATAMSPPPVSPSFHINEVDDVFIATADDVD